MDGTCLNSRHRITPENMEAMRRAAETGVLIVPTTGRTSTCLPVQLQQEDFYRYIISSNGAAVSDRQEKAALYRARIPCEDASELLRACGEAGLGLSVHADNQFLIEGRGLYTLGRILYGADARNSKYVPSILRVLEREKTDVEEIQLFFFSDKKRRLARALLERCLGLTAAYDRFYVEIYAPEASKGHALAALARQLQIPREEVACIGDAENDLSMFDAAGVKFAMGNAIPALKERADAVVPDNDASGVAAAIRRYVLA